MMNVVGGEVPGEVALLADELSRAVELTHLPTVSHEQRIQAYNACERYLLNISFQIGHSPSDFIMH